MRLQGFQCYDFPTIFVCNNQEWQHIDLNFEKNIQENSGNTTVFPFLLKYFPEKDILHALNCHLHLPPPRKLSQKIKSGQDSLLTPGESIHNSILGLDSPFT